MFTKVWFVIMKNQKQCKCPTNRDTLNRYGRPYIGILGSCQK